MKEEFSNQLRKIREVVDTQTNEFTNYEIDKYQAWSEDQLFNLNSEVIELRRELDAVKRLIRKESNASKRLTMVEEEKKLTKKWRNKQTQFFEKQDECDDKLDNMIKALRSSMDNQFNTSLLFKFRWKII